MPDKRVTELAAIDTVADVDLLLVIDDPAGTAVNKKATVSQLLVNVARTDVSNEFTGDQLIDGDLFVTGEINPVVIAEQTAKIDQFLGVSPGDPTGSRTVMSQSLISGLSIRHDEDLSLGKITVGNYDAQIYQPLLLECETFQVHTGLSPGDRVERLRVHPTGGVTIGSATDHTLDPGVGTLAATFLDIRESLTPLDPAPTTARLYALDVNGYTQVEMRDANANAVRFASDNIIVGKVAGVAITRGQCVYLSGAIGANPLVGLARADSTTTMPTIGLALDSGVVNDFIRVLVAGTLQLLNTAAFTEGDRLYVSPTTAGALTTTQPVAPNFAQRLGFVTRSHATQGEVLVLTTSVDTAPRLHKATHEAGGTDALTTLSADILLTGTVPAARLTAANLPAHASRHNTGGADALTALDASILTTGTLPAARLTAANLPTHASRHQTGGADAIALDTLAAPTDITTLNASTTAHGLLKKLSNVATQYMNGTGNWTVPAGGAGDVVGPGSAVSGNLPSFSGTTGKLLVDSGILAANVALLNQTNTFTVMPQVFSAVSPKFQLNDPTLGTDLKRWTLGMGASGTFSVEARSDADALLKSVLQLTRAGAVSVGERLTVATDIYEKGRSAAIGHWVDIAFNAADFTAGGSMVWTVEAGDLLSYAYTVIGKTLLLIAYLNTTSISGTPDWQLFIKIPGGFTAAKIVTAPSSAYDNGLGVNTFNRAGYTDSTRIEIARFDTANWSLATNNTTIRVDMRIPIN